MAKYNRQDYKTAIPQLEKSIDDSQKNIDDAKKSIKDTQGEIIAIKTRLNGLLDFFYPVGTIYETTNADFNPNITWGGTWEKIEGRVLVGSDEDDTDFDTVGEIGGAKTRTLSASIGASNDNNRCIAYIGEGPSQYQTITAPLYSVVGSSATSGGSWNHSTPVTEYESTDRNVNFMPPYQVVAIWKRIS